MEEITSRNNAQVKFVAGLAKSRKRRYEEKFFCVEGLRLSLEAARFSPEPLYAVFVTREMLSLYPEEVLVLEENAEKIYCVPEHVLEKLADTRAPQGVFCVCRMLDKCFSADTIESGGKYILLENISDPGNLGTIMRTAEALGIRALLLCGNCTDVYAPKTVRGTMGGIFRLPVYSLETGGEALEAFGRKGIPVWAAVPDMSAEPLSSLKFPDTAAVFIGNEGSGLTRETVEQCEKRVCIDMAGRAESLNAASAASILMWEMCKPGGEAG